MGSRHNFNGDIGSSIAHTKDQPAQIRVCLQRSANLGNDRVEQAITAILRAVCDINLNFNLMFVIGITKTAQRFIRKAGIAIT